MICSQCRFENPPTMKFCVECGLVLQVACRSCSTLMLPTYKFCGECGSVLEGAPEISAGRATTASPLVSTSLPRPVPAASDPAGSTDTVSSEGERKPVTVLFCTLPTEISDQGSPDHLHDLLSMFFRIAESEVEGYGGIVQRSLGQGFMALFGAPVAYEDHPRRALLAALDLLETLRNTEKLTDFLPSIGIDTGPVVVGGPGGMAVGEATTISTGLQEAAASGKVLLSDTTAKMVRRYASLNRRESVVIDGKTVEAWHAERNLETGTVSPFDRATPFIGRDRELSILEQLREQARAGRGQVVAVTGEAGSGKSRLLHELYARTYGGDHDVSYLRGQCASYATGVPYFPFVDMIRNASGIHSGDSHLVARQKLEESLENVGTEAPETLPFLLRLLGLEGGEEVLERLEPQAIQARTFAAMRRMLLDAARHSLVVIEIEDLQWIDATSAEFLDTLIDSIAAAKMLVILTYRAGYQPVWLEKSYASQVRIPRLSEEESRRLVSEILIRADQDENLADNILAKAEGNPFFLEEMVQTFIEGSEEDSLPSTVQGILMARLDRLPDGHKQLLRAVSVLGRELPMELVRAVWDDESGDLQRLLEDLQRWELLYKAPFEEQNTYFFRQALTQEVVYQSLLASRRESLHRRAAHALERLYEGRLEDAYDRLVHHYPKSGEPEKTIHYLTLFARKAAADNAHIEAAQALREAMAQTTHLPQADRNRQIVKTVLQLAESLLPLAAFPETLELFVGNVKRAAALKDPKLAGPYYFWLAHTFTYLGYQEETREYAEKAIEAARSCDDETTEGKARYVLGRDGFWSGKFRTGIENSLKAVVLLERNDEPWWQGQAYWVAGFNHFVLGQFEQAIDALERTLALGEALDDYRLDTSWSLGHFYASLGEPEIGIERCREGLERSQDPLNTGVSTGFLGHAMLQKGEDLEGAVDSLERAVDLMSQTGMQQLEGWFATFLSEALTATGDFEGAEKAATRGLDISTESRFWYGVALAESALGRSRAADGKPTEARSHLESARERFKELAVPLEVARLDLDLGRIDRHEGNAQASKERFERAKAELDRLGVPFWIQKADEALAEVDS